MKRIFCSPDSAEVGLLEGMLKEAGVSCVDRNEQVSQAFPTAPFYPELWVVNDEDYPRAIRLLEAWRHPAFEIRPPWTCPKCGEVLEGQFRACWKCGTERDTAA